MFSLKLWVGVGICVGVVAVGAAVAACASNAPTFTPPSQPADAACTDGLMISLPPDLQAPTPLNALYSAFDGKHPFKVPAVALTNADVLWTASDRTYASLPP